MNIFSSLTYHVFLPLVLLLTAPFAGHATEFPNMIFPASTGIQFKNDDLTTTSLNLAGNTGVGCVRKAIYWETIEPTPGNYVWTEPDNWISLMQSRGWSMIITVVWNNRDYESLYERAITTDAGRTAYANFVRLVAARYAGKNIIWEIWNEPNLGVFWHGGSTLSNTDTIADEYTALVRAAAPAFKQGDPACRVVAGSVSCLYSSSFSWLSRCISQGLLTSGIDGLSVHPYGFPYPEQSLIEGYGSLRNILTKAGAGNLPVINSEVGFALNSLVGLGIPVAETLNYQGYMYVRQNLIDAMAGIRTSIWYEWRDVQPPAGENAPWGVVNWDLSLRPTYNTARTMTAQLAGYQYLERINNNNADEYLLIFRNGAGQRKLVAWCRTRTSYQISLPISTSSSSLSGCDAFGNARTLPVASGRVTLTVSAAPQYVTLPAPITEPPVFSTFNLARVGSVNVSSGGATSHYLIDGVVNNTNSRWFSAGTETYPQWVEVDLKKNYDLTKVRYLQYAERTDNYNIQVWNGSSWQMVASGVNNTAMNIEHTFAPTRGSKVRFNVLSGPDYQKVYEMEVYGQSIPAGGSPLLLDPATMTAYATGQDQTGSATVSANRLSLTLTGNRWKKFPLTYNVTSRTVLRFTVNSSDTGEIIALGLDNNNIYTDVYRAIQLGGSAVFTESIQLAPADRYVAGSGAIQYEILLGSYYTGAMTYLFFVADDDADASANVTFSNIEIFEQ